jgi:hypothetical protein
LCSTAKASSGWPEKPTARQRRNIGGSLARV